MTRGRIGVVALGLLLVSGSSGAAEKTSISWHPSKPRPGDVAWLHVQDVAEIATVEGSVDGRPLTFFPYAGGHAALLGIDLEVKPGAHAWRVGVVEQGREPRSAQGKLWVARRDFPLQRLTLPDHTIRIARLKMLYVAAKIVVHGNRDQVRYSEHEQRAAGLIDFLDYLDRRRAEAA